MSDLVRDLARPEAAERLDHLLQMANDAFFEVDLASRTVTWSSGLRLFFGHEPSRVGANLDDWTRLLQSSELDELRTAIRELIGRRGSAWSQELRLPRADGSYAPVRVRMSVLYDGDRAVWVVGSVADLTAVRALEDEIEAVTSDLNDEVARERYARIRSELLLRSSMTEVLGEWDLRTDELTWSPNVAEVLGRPVSDLATMKLFLQYAPGGERAAEEARAQVLVGGTGWSGRIGWIRLSGEQVTLAINSYVLRDANGDPLRMVGSLRTLTSGHDGAGVAVPWPRLTPRQSEVLERIRRGKTNKEIAEELGMSEQGAKAIVSRLLRKFGAPNRAALVAAASGPQMR